MSDQSSHIDKRFTEIFECTFCSKKAKMERVATYEQNQDYEAMLYNSEIGQEVEATLRGVGIFDILLCPNCNKVMFRCLLWNEDMNYDEEEGWEFDAQILYPQQIELPRTAPKRIKEEYAKAELVKNIDPTSYGVHMGRVLEMMCIDRNASGQNLSEKLRNLAEKGEIPEKLAVAANALRDFRNISAHANVEDLTAAEVPILSDLCIAILEYVYGLPYLIKRAEQSLDRLKPKKQ